MSLLLLVGTKRGAFLLRGDSAQAGWTVDGPLANPGWSFGVTCVDPASGALYAAGHNAWFGPAVWHSHDQGRTWSHSSEGITFGESGPGIKQVWSLVTAHGRLYAGTDPAGLFVSDDGGQTFQEAGTPLRSLPEAAAWRSGRAGTAIHSIVPNPENPDELWLGISGGGVLHTADGGSTWAERNPQGAPLSIKLKAGAGPAGLLYQQNHKGLFRTADGGANWQMIGGCLPTSFAFAIAAHPSQPETLYALPMKNEGNMRSLPDDRLAVYRTRDGGDSWEALTSGLPEGKVYGHVFRECLITATGEPGAVALGVSTGHVYVSLDDGNTWVTAAAHLPEVLALSLAAID